jgi:hypothetical protein
MSKKKPSSFFENSQDFEVTGGHFGETKNRIQRNNFYGPIYGFMETAIANDAPVIAYNSHITVGESHVDYGQHKEASPSSGKKSESSGDQLMLMPASKGLYNPERDQLSLIGKSTTLREAISDEPESMTPDDMASDLGPDTKTNSVSLSDSARQKLEASIAFKAEYLAMSSERRRFIGYLLNNHGAVTQTLTSDPNDVGGLKRDHAESSTQGPGM